MGETGEPPRWDGSPAAAAHVQQRDISLAEAAQIQQWDVSPAEAAQVQRRLRGRLVSHDEPPDLPARVRVVAGVDNAYVRQPDGGTLGIGVAVALSFPALAPLEWSVATAAVRFPYVPGLLAFREVPVMLAALARIIHEGAAGVGNKTQHRPV